MKNSVKIAITVVMALVTGFLTYLWLDGVREEQTSFTVFRASSDIVGGRTEFSSEVIERVSFPEEYRSNMGGLVIEATASNLEALRGRVFSRNVNAGSLLLFEYLETSPEGQLSGKLAPGRRALTIPVNGPATVGYFVEPGSLVDILGTVMQAPDPAQGGFANNAAVRLSTVTILQAVRVLAVGGARNPGEYQQLSRSGYNSVTVEVAPEEAEKLVFAMQQVQGGLTLILRNPDDAALVETPSVDWQSWWREAVALEDQSAIADDVAGDAEIPQ